MIPKKIHYCWLSGDPMSKDAHKCIESWHRVMPDYELVLWDKTKFNINSVNFVAEACRKKKWAFAADYIRLYAVYNEGGIYLDSDVYVRKRLDDFFCYDYFTAIEQNFPEIKSGKERFSLQAAIFGGIAGHPFLKDCMNWYVQHSYSWKEYNENWCAPDVYAQIAREYGFEDKYGKQELKYNMGILPASVFPFDIRANIYNSGGPHAIHLCKQSWTGNKIVKKIIRNRYFRKLLKLRPIESMNIFDNLPIYEKY